jgi:hypothetical protein
MRIDFLSTCCKIMIVALVLAGSLHASVTRAYFQSNWHAAADTDGQCCNMRRLGQNGDGGKMVCMSDLQTIKDVTLVSIGSSNDFSFETAFREAFPRAHIHVYDGTVGNPNVPIGMQYHNENVDESTLFPYLTRELTAILKIDCEGCEFEFIPKALKHYAFSQIFIEVHGDRRPFSTLQRFMKHLNTSHSIFYAEPNIQFTDGNCIEFSLRQRSLRPPKMTE